jgi:hypothetical protein
MKFISKIISVVLFCTMFTACTPEAKSATVFSHHIKCWDGVSLLVDQDVTSFYYGDYGYVYTTSDSKKHYTNTTCIIDEL